MPPFIIIRREGDAMRVAGIEHFEAAPDNACGFSAGWDWNGTVLRARTDRYGSYPIYYHARHDEVRVSPSLQALLDAEVPLDFDEHAIAAFLQFGCFLGEDTPFRAIRILPADGRLEWRPNGAWNVESGARPIAAQALSRRAAQDAFIDAFHSAVQRRPPIGRPVVSLTGGRDSRHLLLVMLKTHGVRPSAVSVRHFDANRAADVRVASQVATAADISHQILDQYSSQLQSELRMSALCSFSTDWHAWSLPLVDHLEVNKGIDLYTGHGGDAITRGRPLNAERLRLWCEGDSSALADRMLSGRPDARALMQHLIKPEKQGLLGMAVARERLLIELGRHFHQPNPEMSYTMEVGLKRRTAPLWFPMCSDHARVVVPYLDDDLTGLMASLPASLALDESFHTEAIARAFPEFASLPFSGHTPNQHHFRGMHPFAREALRYVQSRRDSAFFSLPRLAKAIRSHGTSGDKRQLDLVQLPRILCLLELEQHLDTHVFQSRSAGAGGSSLSQRLRGFLTRLRGGS